MIAKLRPLGLACVVVVSLSVTGALAAQPVPTQNSYTAFVAALSALTAAGNSVIQGERNAGRLAEIRQALTTKLLSTLPAKAQSAAAAAPAAPAAAGAQPPAKPATTISLDGVLDEALLLCHFRAAKIPIVDPGQLSRRDPEASITVNHLLTVAQQNYLNLVISQLQAITPPNASDIPSALKELFTSYQVNAPDASLQPSAVQKIAKQVEDSCDDDLKEFDAAYYGKKIQPPAGAASLAAPVPLASATGLPALSFLGPIGVLFDTATGILAPVFVDLSNFIVAAREKRAISKFLSDTNRQKTLRDEGLALGRSTSDYLFAQRLEFAGAFAEQIAAIRSIDIDLTKIDSCKAPVDKMFARSASGAPSQFFMSCYHAVWAQLQDAVDNALKTASSYDQVADAGDTNTAINNYKKITTDSNFAIIANSSDVVSKDKFWQEVNDLISFAGAVSNAFSKSNVTKLQQAFDAVSK